MKKLVKAICLASVPLLLAAFASCDNPASGGYVPGGSTDPSSYGQSTLPDLSQSDPFKGQSYVTTNVLGYGMFFNSDGTVVSKNGYGERNGSVCYAQWQKNALGSYTYNPSTKKLVIKVLGKYFGDNVARTADEVAAFQLAATQKQAQLMGLVGVDIAPEYIAAQKKNYELLMSNNVIQYACSIQGDVLSLDDEFENKGSFKYESGGIKIKFKCPADGANNIGISVKTADGELVEPVITEIGNGVFKGSDFYMYQEDGIAKLKKLGDFSGTYTVGSGSCEFKLTSVTGDIAQGVKALIGTDFSLPQRTDALVNLYYPVLKTVNYSVFGSDGVLATSKAQMYIIDSSESVWSLDTLQILNQYFIAGIYSDSVLATSIVGKNIVDGSHVYVKLNEDTADEYNYYVGNYY